MTWLGLHGDALMTVLRSGQVIKNLDHVEAIRPNWAKKSCD